MLSLPAAWSGLNAVLETIVLALHDSRRRRAEQIISEWERDRSDIQSGSREK